MTRFLIFLIGLLIPSAKPCLSVATGVQQNLPTCIQSLPALESKLKFANFFLHRRELTATLELTDALKPLLPYTDYFLGREKPITYLVLLENNHEMRANGGFFGSYAVISLDRGQTSFRFQDIYVPDGALLGHVDPPAPIQTAFKQGWFRLRDADWEPDWPTTAQTIRWFLVKGNEINPDVLVTINLATIEKIIAVLGEVDLPEYDLKLTSDNLYALLQNKSEIDSFPGSTQKKDVITAAGRALANKLAALSSTDYLAIAKILAETAARQNLLINSTNPQIQSLLENKNWAGQLLVPPCPKENCLADTVLLIETNLGANKANCCVDRKTTHIITKSETEVSHLISLTFINNSPLENPLPPRFFGGNYISYLRYYIPENANHIRLTAQPTLPKTLSQYPAPFDGLNQKNFDRQFAYGLTEIGFFHTTAAGSRSAVQLSYDLPLDGNPSSYQLNLLKQHGLESSPAEINLFGKTSATDLTSDFSAITPL